MLFKQRKKMQNKLCAKMSLRAKVSLCAKVSPVLI